MVFPEFGIVGKDSPFGWFLFDQFCRELRTCALDLCHRQTVDCRSGRITMTDLNSLMIFAKVVSRLKRVSEAARRLKMPTSTVSRRVADSRINRVRLLERVPTRKPAAHRLLGPKSRSMHSTPSELSEAGDNIVQNHLSNVSGGIGAGLPRHPASPTRCLRRLVTQSKPPTQRPRTGFIHQDRIRPIKSPRAWTWCSRSGNNSKCSSLVARRILTYGTPARASRSI